MKKLLLLITLAVILSFPLLSSSAGEPDTVKLNVREFTLKNGMTVLILERHTSPTVAVNLVFKVGSVNEHSGITGISHIVEHMLFKGTERIGTTDYQKEKPYLDQIDALTERLKTLKAQRAKLPSNPQPEDQEISELQRQWNEAREKARQYWIPDQMSMIYQENGAKNLNGGTGQEDTSYYCELPANKLELWAWLESDRYAHPVWREFEVEKGPILSERMERVEANPDGTLWEQFNALSYIAHPLRLPTIGWRSDVEAITKPQMDEHFHQYYAPNNAIAVIVGDVETDSVMELMRKYFEPIPPSPKPVPPVVTLEPPQESERRTVLELDSQPKLLIGYHTIRIGEKDDYTLDVVQEILSGGRTGRLYQNLVLGKELCTDIYTDNATGKYPGLFIVSATPKGKHTSEEVEKTLYAELERLKTEAVPEPELVLAKKRLAVGYLRGLDNNLRLAHMLGDYEANCSWKYITDVVAKRNAVTAEDIKAAAQKYFVAGNRTVATVVTTKKEIKPKSLEEK